MILAGLMSLSVLAGCGGGESGATSADCGKGKIGVFIAQNGNKFTMTVGEAAKQRGEEPGYEVSVFDGQADQDTQVGQIENCIIQGYKGLIVEPVSNDGLNTVFRDAMNAGIAVVTVVRTCAVQDEITAFAGADYEEASYIEAKAALEAIGGKGKVCILNGQMGTSGEMVCTQGFDCALAEFPDVEVLEKQAADWQTDKGLQVTETWLQKYSDIDAILAQDDPMALGAVKACTDAGKTDIVIIGRNGDTAALQAIKDGQMLLTVQSNPTGMGSTAAEVGDKAINGEQTEANYATDNTVITIGNVKEEIPIKIAFDGSAFWETGMTYEKQYDVVARAGYEYINPYNADFPGFWKRPKATKRGNPVTQEGHRGSRAENRLPDYRFPLAEPGRICPSIRGGLLEAYV